jgi:hypothetical protein
MIPAIGSEQDHPLHARHNWAAPASSLGGGVFRTMPLKSISPFDDDVSTPMVDGPLPPARGSFGVPNASLTKISANIIRFGNVHCVARREKHPFSRPVQVSAASGSGFSATRLRLEACPVTEKYCGPELVQQHRKVSALQSFLHLVRKNGSDSDAGARCVTSHLVRSCAQVATAISLMHSAWRRGCRK